MKRSTHTAYSYQRTSTYAHNHAYTRVPDSLAGGAVAAEGGLAAPLPTPIIAHPSNALAVISNICHGSSATARTLADGARSSLAAHVQASAQAVLKGVRPLVP